MLTEDAEVLRQRLYTRREEMSEGQLPVPLKLIQINRCPVVAPLSVLRGEDQQRLGLDMTLYQQRAEQLSAAQAVWQNKLSAIYDSQEFAPSEDPEQQLYDGFIGDRDRRLCEQVRTVEPEQLATGQWMFDDARLPELLFRYRARNFPQTLDAQERQRWLGFCQQRLSDPAMGAPNTLEGFEQALQSAWLDADATQRELLAQWRAHAMNLRERFALQ